MNIIFNKQLEAQKSVDSIYIAPSHVREIIQSPYREHVLENDGIKINLYLSDLINDKFYVLVIVRQNKDFFYVEERYKILKDLVVEDKLIDPFIVLQKFAWRFGNIIKIGDQLGKFIYKERIVLPNSVLVKKKIFEILGAGVKPGETIEGRFYYKEKEEKNNRIAVCFLLFSIFVDRYKAWIDGDLKKENNEEAQILKEELLNCPLGKVGWKNYEDISFKIIEYLFRESFSEFRSKIQSRTVDGLERRDLIVTNNVKSITSFWGNIKSEFSAKHIIFEFKNLQDEIGKDEIYQVDDYTNKAIGFFAIIFSRKGLSEAGKRAVMRKYNGTDKVLILNCTDEDLIKMLEFKNSGKDPTEFLQEKKNDFELSY